jgi:RNA polymerase sigma-70 factor (ECF subfamily)
VRARDDAALAAVYDRYCGIVYSFCLRALGDAGEAEDLLIDVFFELWERGDRYDPQRGKPISYILGLTRSRAIDRLRMRRTRAKVRGEEIGEEAAARESDVNSPPNAAMRIEDRDEVRRALGMLASEQREALELTFFDALSHSEIADQLGVPLGTIKSRIRRGLINLRGLLEGRE